MVSAHLGELARGFDHQGRLVAFAAVRDGREIGRVGLDQEAIVGCDARGFADVFGRFEGQDAAEAEMETQVESFAAPAPDRR